MSTGHWRPAACRPRHVWWRRSCQKVCCSVLLECVCSIFFQELLPNCKTAQTQSCCTGRGGGSCFSATAEGESLTDSSLVLASPELYWICDVALAQFLCYLVIVTNACSFGSMQGSPTFEGCVSVLHLASPSSETHSENHPPVLFPQLCCSVIVCSSRINHHQNKVPSALRLLFKLQSSVLCPWSLEGFQHCSHSSVANWNLCEGAQSHTEGFETLISFEETSWESHQVLQKTIQ